MSDLPGRLMAMARVLEPTMYDDKLLRKAAAEIERLQTSSLAKAWALESTRRIDAEARASRFEKALREIAGEQWCQATAERNIGAVIDASCPTCVARAALAGETRE